MKLNPTILAILLGASTLGYLKAQQTVVESPTTAPTDSTVGQLTTLPTKESEPELKAKPAELEPAKETLSVDFPDEDVRNVVRNVADLYELNIIIPDTLQGRVSIKLKDVTWRQIFRSVLEQKGHGFREEDGVIKILTMDQMASEPPKTVVVKMNNVSITNIKPILDPLLSAKREKTETSPEVRGGNIVLNSFSNELIITDLPQVAEQVAAMAKRLDVEPRQVVIETKFIEVSRAASLEMGARFDTNNTFSGSSNRLQTTTLANGTTSQVGTFNALLSTQDLQVALRLLAGTSQSKIVSNPTVIAISGRPSLIEVKRLEPTVQESVGNGDNSNVARTITYDEKIYEGVTLTVTPNISTNDLVNLGIEAEKQDLPQNSRIAAADLVRRKAKLEMIIKNGYTAAIGGLLDTVNDKSNSRVPIIGDIPVLGNLFKQKQDRQTERNLMIFITASILVPSSTTYENLVTPSRMSDLDLTPRDLEGVTYNDKISPEERELLDRAKAERKAKQDAKILNYLQPKPVKGGAK